MQYSVKDLTTQQVPYYTMVMTSLEENELSRLRQELGDHAQLSKEARKELQQAALIQTADEFGAIGKVGKRNRKRPSKRLQSPEATKVTQAAIKCVSEPDIKGKGRAEPTEPVEVKPLPSAPKAKKEKTESISLPPMELPEPIEVTPPKVISISEVPFSTSEDGTLSQKLTHVTNSLETKVNMTEGKPNAFYPVLNNWKEIINGSETSEKHVKGIQKSLFEAQKLKNALEVLNKTVVDYSQYDQEVVTLLRDAWTKSEELEQFITSNEKTKWGPMHEQLKVMRTKSVPLPFSGSFEPTNQSVSSHTSSQKPEDVEPSAKYVKQLKESRDVRGTNYRLSYWCDKLLQSHSERIHVRIDEITDYLQRENIKRFESISKTQKKSVEHVLSKNNKQKVIQDQLLFIDKVLAFKETLDVVKNALSKIERTFQTDYIEILEKYKKVFDKEYARITAAAEENEKCVKKAIEELQKVIDEEKVPGYDTTDINSISVLIDDPAAVKELRKATGTRESIRHAAITQKLILEKFLENADIRMTKTAGFFGYAVTISEGVIPLYEQFCTKLESLKKEKASSS